MGICQGLPKQILFDVEGKAGRKNAGKGSIKTTNWTEKCFRTKTKQENRKKFFFRFGGHKREIKHEQKYNTRKTYK